MVSLTYRTQDLVKTDNESFELEHIFKCDRNILVPPHQFTKCVLGKLKSLTSVRQQDATIMDMCVLLTSTPLCVVSPRRDHEGAARRGETTHSGVDHIYVTHLSMISLFNKLLYSHWLTPNGTTHWKQLWMTIE